MCVQMYLETVHTISTCPIDRDLLLLLVRYIDRDDKLF